MLKLFLLGLLVGVIRGLAIWLSERAWYDRAPVFGA